MLQKSYLPKLDDTLKYFTGIKNKQFHSLFFYSIYVINYLLFIQNLNRKWSLIFLNHQRCRHNQWYSIKKSAFR